jgi:hypothetical protein
VTAQTDHNPQFIPDAATGFFTGALYLYAGKSVLDLLQYHPQVVEPADIDRLFDQPSLFKASIPSDINRAFPR